MAKAKGKNATDSKKVGGAAKSNAKADDKPEKESKKRIPFEGKAPEGGWDAAVPEGFKFDKHLILKKDDFAAQHTFMRHRAASLEIRAEALSAEAKALNVKAERYEALGDEKTRSKVKRAERIAGQLEGLVGDLKDAGVDIEAILLAVKEKADAKAAEAEGDE